MATENSPDAPAPAAPDAPAAEGEAPAPDASGGEAGGEAGEQAAAPGEAPKKPDPMAAKFASLAKSEAKLRADRDALKKEREEVDTYKKERAAFEALKSRNPLAAMKKLGLTYQQLTDLALSGVSEDDEGEEPKPEPLHPEVAKMQERIATLEREKQEGIIANFRHQLDAHARANAEKYEYVAAYGQDGLDTVFAYIENNVNKETGEVPSFDDALAAVESAFERAAEPLLKVKKLQGKIAPVQPKPAVTEQPESRQGAPKSSPRTLTNAAAANAPKRPLSKAERLEAAAAALRFKE